MIMIIRELLIPYSAIYCKAVADGQVMAGPTFKTGFN